MQMNDDDRDDRDDDDVKRARTNVEEEEKEREEIDEDDEDFDPILMPRSKTKSTSPPPPEIPIVAPPSPPHTEIGDASTSDQGGNHLATSTETVKPVHHVFMRPAYDEFNEERATAYHITRRVMRSDGMALIGLVKTVPDDFVVNEIDLNGNVVRFTPRSKSPTAAPSSSSSSSSSPAPSPAPASSSSSSTLSHEEKVERLIGDIRGVLLGPNPDTASEVALASFAKDEAALRSLLATPSSGGDATNPPLTSVLLEPNQDKSKRGKVHELMRRHFGNMIVTVTDEACRITVTKTNDKGAIAASNRRANQFNRSGNKGNNNNNKPGFFYFPLMKREMDLNHVLGEMAERTKIGRNYFNSAGIKDKNGVTTQLICVKTHDPARIYKGAPASRHSREHNPYGSWYDVGNVVEGTQLLRLGDLAGNRFSIAVRDLKMMPLEANEHNWSSEAARSAVDHALVGARVESWKSRGFINYFGLQRFGTGAVGTHVVGLRLVNRDWGGALELILTPHEGGEGQADEARRRFLAGKDEKDPEIARRLADDFLSRVGQAHVAERAVVQAWKEASVRGWSSANFTRFLDRIPKHLKTMYVHALQSYVWNAVATARYDAHGAIDAVVGDLVEVEETEKSTVPTSSSNASGSNNSNNAGDDEEDDAGGGARPRSTRRVRRLTPDDFLPGATRKYTARDVVLPLPGYDVIYPQTTHITVETYASYLVSMGVREGLTALRNDSQRVFSLSGDYRRFLEIPGETEWRLRRYDGDEMRVASFFDMGGRFRESADNGGGDRTALLLSFNLSPGTYATVALRELFQKS